MAKFLFSGQQVKREVRRIFGNGRHRRVAVVAFVGKHAEAYLPKPKGLELICWPHAPGTNPQAIRQLIKKGVDVSFVERLHMKVYWSEVAGAVISSANLSTNAYGSGNLHEAGATLPSTAVNIEALLREISPTRATEAALRKLERQWSAAKKKSGGSRSASQRTFGEWLSMPKRAKWLLHAFDSYGGRASQRLRAAALEETGSPNVVDWVFCRKSELSPEDFVLCLNLDARAKPRVEKWVFVHRVVLVAQADKQHDSRWPYQAGQLHPTTACPPPPFKIDTALRQAFRAAYKALDADEDVFSLERTGIPGSKLISLLEKHYQG